MIVQTRAREVGVAATDLVESKSVQLMYAYVASATFWLLIGTAVGLLIAQKLNWPEVLDTSV